MHDLTMAQPKSGGKLGDSSVRRKWSSSCGGWLKTALHWRWRQEVATVTSTRSRICYRFDEDGGYCFLKCKLVGHCWRDLQMEEIHTKLMLETLARNFVVAIMNLETSLCITMVLLIWKWWDNRNKVNGDELMQSSQELPDGADDGWWVTEGCSVAQSNHEHPQAVLEATGPWVAEN